ncbi:MAG: Gfo/Idh/MocA family oxidoreductase [Candidatus Caldarchaeum sp.]
MTRLTLGIAGCGGFGNVHIRRLKGFPECKITALCDPDQKRLEETLSKNFPDTPPPATFSDMREMIEHAKPDAVVIATPHTLHYEQGVLALKAGCHVLMEKPMVTNPKHARDLAKLAEKSGKVFLVGYNTPFLSGFQYVRAVVESGELGSLQTVIGWMSQNWHRFTQGTWRQDPSLSGGGMLYDSGAHLFAGVVWVVGERPTQVTAFLENKDAPVDLSGAVALKFSNDVLATLTISGVCQADGSQALFCFEKGRILVDWWGHNFTRVYCAGAEPKDISPAKDSTPDENFVKAILEGESPITPARLGVILTDLMDAVYTSARQGTTVAITHE